jgi:DNA-binding NtrC family response regulator
LALLVAAPWPGNVRQLRNLVDRLAVFSDEDEISASTATAFLERREISIEAPKDFAALVDAVLRSPIEEKLRFCEQALIESALLLSNDNKTAAARLLGVHRKVIERAVVRAR